MELNRRTFLVGAAAFGGLRAFAVPAGAADFGAARLKVGILSDVHVNRGRLPETCATLKRAFEYFRDNGADAVLIAGDMADTGRVVELEAVAKTWFEVFPGDKAPDGRPVERVFMYGNHCVNEWGWGEKKGDELETLKRECVSRQREAVWERLFHEKYERLTLKKVKGYTFIASHWTNGNTDELGAFLAAHAADLDPKKPFFYAQHAHPANTCFNDWAWGRDNGESTKALSKYPNAVAFSGHSHYSFTDERDVWQGAFTSIGTSSLSYSSCDYNYRENMLMGSRKDRRPLRMGTLGTWEGRQGLFMTVYDDALVFRRREFVYGESLGDDWVVPTREKAFDYASRAAKRVAPEFAAGAKPVVKVDAEKKTLDVCFPAAETREKCRVFEYEVTAFLCEEDVELVHAQRRVIAPDFHLPQSKAGRPGNCTFGFDDLPKNARFRFEVRPLECFGKKGRAIATDAFTTPA